MFGAVLPPHTVIPGRLRAFAQANLSHSNWSGGESRHVHRKTLRDSGLSPVRFAVRPAPE
jgi:hypothetical protein